MSSTGRIQDRQQDDFYETPAWATDAILPFLDLSGHILEPAAGHGAIALRLLAAGVARDRLHLNELDGERAKKCSALTTLPTLVSDFLTPDWYVHDYDLVITNPPYIPAQEFIEQGQEAATMAGEVAMLLRLNFLSGLKRVAFWKKNPADIFVLPKRPSYLVIVRDVYKCARCKREWKVPQGAGPFAVPPEDQCECGEIPAFKKTVKTANDSCEYAWFVFGPKRSRRYTILELPEQVEGNDARVHRAHNRRLRGHVHKAEG
jgi:hypothetical protein